MSTARDIANLIILRYAKWKKIEVDEKPWNHPKLKSEYIRQIQKASALLAVYPYATIVNTLQRPENRWMASLYNKKLVPEIQRVHYETDRSKKKEQIIIETQEEKPFVPVSTSKGSSKRKKLD